MGAHLFHRGHAILALSASAQGDRLHEQTLRPMLSALNVPQ